MHDVADERSTIGLGRGFDPDAIGQDERKYGASNRIVRWLIERLCSRIADIVGATDGPILDVGTGEGLAIARVTELLSAEGQRGNPRPVICVEYRVAKIRAARRRNPAMVAVVADIGTLPFRDGAVPTVLCMEVLEHLDRPAAALRELRRVADGRVVVSVPFEPIFRLGNLMRGKNIRLAGNDPEHVQQFNPRRLRKMAHGTSTLDHHRFDPDAVDPDAVEIALALPWMIGVAQGRRAAIAAAHVAGQLA